MEKRLVFDKLSDAKGLLYNVLYHFFAFIFFFCPSVFLCLTKIFLIFSGVCLIINNRYFTKDPEDENAKLMPEREGTDSDRGIYILY